MEGGDGSVAVDGCLSGKTHVGIVVPVVETEIGEVAAFSGITAIGDVLLLGCQSAIHVGIYCIGIDKECAFPPSHADAQVGFVSVVLLVHQM